jgi:hypothetical protein
MFYLWFLKNNSLIIHTYVHRLEDGKYSVVIPAKISTLGFLCQDFYAKISMPGFLCQDFYARISMPGANLATLSFNPSDVKIYSATNSMGRFLIIFLLFSTLKILKPTTTMAL